MTVKGGPKIETDGLVFHLDAASSSIGKGYSTQGLKVEYLVVGGGGGGGGWSTAGGGGAGGFLSGETRLASGTYTVTVGAGGTRGDNGSSRTGTTGGNSQLGNSLVAYGGGGGGSISNLNGLNGGSGGGGVSANTANTGAGGTGVSGQGNNGGLSTPSWRSAGGGGAGGVGTNGWGGYRASRGGVGKISKLDFVWTYYAGGGTSGGCTYAGLNYSGALGGGGSGGMTNSDGGNGGTNLGGGGGGGGCYNTRATFGGHGGSGIVMIRYWGKQKATGGDTIQYKHGYTIHTFTSSGSFVLTESVDGTSRNKIVGSLENMGSNDYKTGNKGYFSFDGSNQAIKLPNFDVSTLGGNFTICSLIKPIGSIGVIFSSLDVSLGSSTKNFLFNFNDTANFGMSANTIRLQFGRSTWAWQVYASNGLSLSKNNWYFVAVTAANLNTSTHTIKFYVNDQVINATKWTAGSTPAPINYGGDMSNSTFLARNYTASSPTYANSYHEINIANIKIYNKTLSNQQILDNYNATKGRFGL